MIACGGIFIIVALKLLSDDYNICVILTLSSIDCVFSCELGFSSFFVCQVFFELHPGCFGCYVIRLQVFV